MANGKPIPSWVYVVGVIISMLGVNGIFAGWSSNAMDKLGDSINADIIELKTELALEIGSMQNQINTRFSRTDSEYTVKLNQVDSKCMTEIHRFYRETEKNGEKLDKIYTGQNDIRVEMKEFRTIQKMVQEKLNLGHP